MFDKNRRIKRRSFLKAASIPLIGGGQTFADHLEISRKKERISVCGELAKRPYGKTGERLSVIGFGGIVVMNVEQSEANRLVADAVERGVNYFDVAPTYGNAEERLGPAIEPFRNEVFLACKTHERNKEKAAASIRKSLKRLRTDHFDLYQIHGLLRMEEVDEVLGPNGALEAIVEARKAGLVRYIGFSVHLEEAGLRIMDCFDFDSVLFPLNFVCYYTGRFGGELLRKAEEKGAAPLALKALARSPYAQNADRSQYPKCWYQPILDPTERNLALRWTLSQKVTAAIPPGHAELFQAAMDIAESFEPLTLDELAKAQELAKGIEPLFKRET